MSQFSLMEMSYVLIEVFGLTSKQVEEVEKNGGLTDADIETEQKYVFPWNGGKKNEIGTRN